MYLRSSFVIDHLSSLNDEQVSGLAYIYFERQEYQRQRPDQVFRCFLRQLGDQNEQVFQYLEDLQTNNAFRQNALSIKELESALVFAIRHFDTTFFVLDALDECDEVEVRRPLLASLPRIEEAGARILLTSRPHPEDIWISLQSALPYEVKAFRDDIIAYIDDFVESNPRAQHLIFGGERRMEIIQRLIASSNGM